MFWGNLIYLNIEFSLLWFLFLPKRLLFMLKNALNDYYVFGRNVEMGRSETSNSAVEQVSDYKTRPVNKNCYLRGPTWHAALLFIQSSPFLITTNTHLRLCHCPICKCVLQKSTLWSMLTPRSPNFDLGNVWNYVST